MKNHKFYLEYARDLSKNSICQKMHFGAIIVKDGKILAEGYNNPYDNKKCDPCLRIGVESGTKLELCRAVHAEQKSLLYALNKQIDISNAIMYVAGTFPDGKPFIKTEKNFYCTFCSRLLNQTKLKGIVIGTTKGPEFMNLEEVLESSFEIATGKKTVKKITYGEKK